MGPLPPRWFVVLPDRDLPRDVAGRLRELAGPAAVRVLPHPSGRPWLACCLPAEEVSVCSAGDVRLAVIGPCSLTDAELAVRAARISATAHVEAALAGAAGCFHVVASVAGHTYVRGSLSGRRRVFQAGTGGAVLHADQARTLAVLSGAGLDTGQLALRLAGATLPPPLDGALWRGVRAVPPGEAVESAPDGGVRTRRWWRPPPAALPLHRAAAGLREALVRSVALRVRPGQVVGADLSGGMDSTSLCFLAAEAGARLVAVTLDWNAATNEDRRYAVHAARHLPGIEHLVFASAALPGHFAGIAEREDPGDGPSPALRDRAQRRHLAQALLARGAAWQLSGHGGDHVVQPPPAYVHGLLRRSPLTGLRHAAGMRARHRWPLGASVRAMIDRRSYAAWLGSAAGHPPGMQLGWGPYPELPPWASEQAVELLRERLRAGAEPLCGERGRHAAIMATQQAGLVAAHLAHQGTLAGLPVHSPFCDDAVIDAALAARPHEAASPWSYKPLLAAAMAGLVPDRVLRRTTKDHCGLEWQEGLRRHRRDLAAWADDSRLVAAGVADAAALRRALLSPGLLTGGAGELEATLGAEAWLRDLERGARPAGREHPDAAQGSGPGHAEATPHTGAVHPDAAPPAGPAHPDAAPRTRAEHTEERDSAPTAP